MGLFNILFGRNKTPHERHMISLIALSDTKLTLTADELRGKLDRVFPGHFPPSRDDRGFVVDGPIAGAQFLVKSLVPGARGIFMVHDVPGPYADVSDYLDHVADPALRRQAAARTCWQSVDLVNGWSGEDEAWRFIAMTLAALAPADAAILVEPGRALVVPWSAALREALADGQRPR